MIVVLTKNPKKGEELQSRFRQYILTEFVLDEIQLSHIAKQTTIKLFVVTPDIDPENIKSIQRQYQLPIYCIGNTSPETAKELFRAGIVDIFSENVDSKAVITKHNIYTNDTLFLTSSVPNQHQQGNLITIASGKGGEGKSSLALQMAIYFNQLELDPLLVDSDPSGNLARWMGQGVIHSLAEFEDDNFYHQEKEYLDSLLTIGSEKVGNIKLLASPLRSTKPIAIPTLEKAIITYRQHYENIIVDTEPAYKPIIQHLAEHFTNHLYFVITEDMMRLERSIETILAMQENMNRLGSDLKIHVIANKIRDEIKLATIHSQFEQHHLPVYALPYDPDLQDSKIALLENPTGPYARALRKMIFETLGYRRKKTTPAPQAPKRSFFNFIPSIKKGKTGGVHAKK